MKEGRYEHHARRLHSSEYPFGSIREEEPVGRGTAHTSAAISSAMKALQNKIKKLENNVLLLGKDNNQLLGKAEERDREIWNLTEKNRTMTEKHKNSKQLIGEKGRVIDKSQEDIRELEKHIEKLMGDREKGGNDIRKANTKLKELSSTVNSLTDELSSSSSKLELQRKNYKELCLNHDIELKNLQMQLKEYRFKNKELSELLECKDEKIKYLKKKMLYLNEGKGTRLSMKRQTEETHELAQETAKFHNRMSRSNSKNSRRAQKVTYARSESGFLPHKKPSYLCHSQVLKSKISLLEEEIEGLNLKYKKLLQHSFDASSGIGSLHARLSSLATMIDEKYSKLASLRRKPRRRPN